MTHAQEIASIEAQKTSVRSMIYSAIRGARKPRVMLGEAMDVPLTWCPNPFMKGEWRRVSTSDCPGLLAEFRVPEGSMLKLHHHEDDEVVTMLSGKARFTVEGNRQIITGGYVLSIPAGTLHEAFFITESHFLVLWTEAYDART